MSVSSRAALHEGTYSRRVAAYALKKRRLTVRSGKGGGNFSKEVIIDSCGPRDGGGCKKRIETSVTFHWYERHVGYPIGTSMFPLTLYLVLPLYCAPAHLSPLLLNISATRRPPRAVQGVMFSARICRETWKPRINECQINRWDNTSSRNLAIGIVMKLLTNLWLIRNIHVCLRVQ